jgi:hypothetical protein
MEPRVLEDLMVVKFPSLARSSHLVNSISEDSSRMGSGLFGKRPICAVIGDGLTNVDMIDGSGVTDASWVSE